MNLRRSGATYSEIGNQVGISGQAAFQHVKKEMLRLAEVSSEDATAIRAIEVDRLDRLQLGIWSSATTGHLGAIDKVLKIMERRAKLLGIDSPTLVAEVPIEAAMSPEEAARIQVDLLSRAGLDRLNYSIIPPGVETLPLPKDGPNGDEPGDNGRKQ
jgi:hypothetical protein